MLRSGSANCKILQRQMAVKDDYGKGPEASTAEASRIARHFEGLS